MWSIRRKLHASDVDDDFVEQFAQLSKRRQELEFIEQATNGDTDRVTTILKHFPDLDRDCPDEKGRTALRLAIRRQHTPVVELLLDVSSAENIYNALLLSIDQDNEDVSELIINHKTYRDYSKEREKEIEKGIDSDTKQDETLFSQDVTPLMLAAQKEQTYVVQLLLELDERIEEPHKYDCPCEDCKVVDTGESLKTARARLNAYRGLCSKVYILQTSKDPILRAFDLCDKTRWLSTQEKHFKKEYSQLQEQLGELVTRLIDRVRTEEELDQLLHEVAGAQKEDSDTEDGTESKEFTRLNLALYREQKTFVSHPYCQRKLMSLWYGRQNLQQKGQSLPETLLKSFFLMLLYPALALIYWIMPDSKLGKKISAPIMKFTSTVFSYLVFVSLIVAFSVIKNPTAGVTLSEHPTIGPHYREYAGISASQNKYDLRSFTFHKSRKLHSFQDETDHVVDIVEIDNENSTDTYNSTEDYIAFTTDNLTFSTQTTTSGEQTTTSDSHTTTSDSQTTTSGGQTTTSSGQTTTSDSQTTSSPPETTSTISPVETTSLQNETTTIDGGNETDSDIMADIMIRYHSVDALTIVICIWVIGYLVHDLKEVYSEPLGYYLASYFNIMDICLLTFYITSFTLRFVTIGKIQSAVRFMSTTEAWQNLNIDGAQIMSDESEVLSHLYWINADRYYWDTYDPYVFCEALFAVANILIICRLAGLLIVNEAMGPLIISLGRMINDIVRFMILFGLVFFAYIIGFLNLYWYYFPDTRNEAEVVEHDLLVNAGDAFGDIEDTFTTAFWALFGMADADSVEIDEGYAISEVTNRIGYILFGVYSVMSVIVFINILIAMMSSSFEHVLESEDMEWKFARTNLYIDFIREGNVLPVPLNLIPTPKAVYQFFRHTLCGACCGKQKSSKNQSQAEAIEMKIESDQSTSHNVYETPPNSESGISSDHGEITSSRSSFENPTLSDLSASKGSDEKQREDGIQEEGVKEEEEEEQVNIYSSPEDIQELWRVRGQLKPESKPSPAYSTVMGKLVHRYFNLGQSTDDNEQENTAASTDKLKQEIDSLRNELRMTTFRLKKDLNTMRLDTKSHLAKVEQQCGDVSNQCSDVSRQCSDVSVQCDNITTALSQLFTQIGNLSKDIAELKTIASKPVIVPQLKVSREASSPKVKSVKITDPTKAAAVRRTSSKTGQPTVPAVNPISQQSASASHATYLTTEPPMTITDVKATQFSIAEQSKERSSSLKDVLPKALTNLFSGLDAKEKTEAKLQQAVQKSSSKLPSDIDKSEILTNDPDDNISNDLVVSLMIEYAIQPPIQPFSLIDLDSATAPLLFDEKEPSTAEADHLAGGLCDLANAHEILSQSDT